MLDLLPECTCSGASRKGQKGPSHQNQHQWLLLQKELALSSGESPSQMPLLKYCQGQTPTSFLPPP